MKKFNLLFSALCISTLLITGCQYNEVKDVHKAPSIDKVTHDKDKLPTLAFLTIDPNEHIKNVNKIEDVNLSLDSTLFNCKKYNKIASNGNKLTTITVVPTDTDDETINNNIKYVTKQVNQLGYDLDKIDLSYIETDQTFFGSSNYLQIKLMFEKEKHK